MDGGRTMPGGWTGKILCIDLSRGDIRTKESQLKNDEYIGGRALAAHLAWEQIPPEIDAYDPDNRIILTTGPLTGTLAPTSGRTVMTGISPRMYPRQWYTHSTIGGWFGPQLKYAGFDGIVIRGKSDSPVYLDIRNDRVKIVDASDLWGLDARTTQLLLKQRVSQEAQVLTIGPAGENRVRFATVQHSEENAAGHSGFGAVWGSKNLKAVVVHGTGSVPVANPNMLLKEVIGMREQKYSNFLGFLYDTGEKKEFAACSQACIFDCFGNFYGYMADGRRVPANCVGTSWTVAKEMQLTRYTGGGIEIPSSKNFALEKEVPLHELCNSLGLDLWFRLVMQPWLTRCTQLGINEIWGYPIAPEDPSWFERFMYQLAHREELGDLFAEDLIRAMDTLEGELPQELIDLGREMEFNFGFPAHREGRFWDEEPLPFWVISAMMHVSSSRDPGIGHHLSSLLLAELKLADEKIARKQFRLLSEKVWGDPDALEPNFVGKAPVAIWSQHQNMIIDSFPLCDFAFPQLIRPFRDRESWEKSRDILGDLDIDLRLLSAVTGESFDRKQVNRVAERAFTLERLMQARAGRSRKMEEQLASHFQLPCRADGTAMDKSGFLRLMDEYYSARGWDLEFGWPTSDLLKSLGLDEAIPELDQLRLRYALKK
jgi:aldehyde:ferredoxin oxidoreductase